MALITEDHLEPPLVDRIVLFQAASSHPALAIFSDRQAKAVIHRMIEPAAGRHQATRNMNAAEAEETKGIIITPRSLPAHPQSRNPAPSRSWMPDQGIEPRLPSHRFAPNG